MTARVLDSNESFIRNALFFLQQGMALKVLTTSTGSGFFKPIYFLALGTFAIGTEGFMIVPLLPKMSADLSVPIAAVG